ncbi:MAG: CO dehydrogenase/CO-methylating acetyl-CoA synthase complex subunit beta [Candidatus Ranarchaeia archaeon]
MSTTSEFPVDVGVIYEGERIRKTDMRIEFGGIKVDKKFELVRVRSKEKVTDGKVVVLGPDLDELEPEKSYRLGIIIEVAGKRLEEDLESVIERRIHDFVNYIEGMMHLNQRYDIHIRISKRSFKKGLRKFEPVGKILLKLFKNELPIIEKMQVTFVTDQEKVESMWDEAMAVYEARDKKAEGLTDEEVDAFYGCSLCQSFAPTHLCAITPQRYSNCGAISWFDGRAAARVDPKGPLFRIDKGECIDAENGEYSGVNQAFKEKSLGQVQRVWLYSAFEYPHTSCGCFEAVAFSIPEVNGLGVIHRDFKGTAVNGLPFSSMADTTAGGRQVPGFHGISFNYMKSPKFLKSDGGWNRIVWIPKSVKERVGKYIPENIRDKIPTEEDVSNLDELRAFLKKHEHPITNTWSEDTTTEEKQDKNASPDDYQATSLSPDDMNQLLSSGGLSFVPPSSGGIKVILENAKLVAQKITLVRESKDTAQRRRAQ